MALNIGPTLGDSLDNVLGGRSAQSRTARVGHAVDQAIAGKEGPRQKRVAPDTEVKEHLKKISSEGLGGTLFGKLSQSPEPTGRTRGAARPSSPSSRGTLVDLFG